MVLGETGLTLIAGNEFEDKMDTPFVNIVPCATVAMDEGLGTFPLLKGVFYYEHYGQTES
jgi:hypothetical protein